jgi:hypothetical protein
MELDNEEEYENFSLLENWKNILQKNKIKIVAKYLMLKL